MTAGMRQLNLILPGELIDAAKTTYTAKGTTVVERVRRMLERDTGVQVPRRGRGRPKKNPEKSKIS